MSLPLYLQGPPDAEQIWSTRLSLNLSNRFLSFTVSAKNLLILLSPPTLPTKSLTTVVIPFFPPSLLYSDFLSPAAAVVMHPLATAAATATTIKFLRISLYSPSV